MSTPNGSVSEQPQHRFSGPSSATMKPCPSSESSNGLKFKIKRTSTEDGRPTNNHVATQILPNGTYPDKKVAHKAKVSSKSADSGFNSGQNSLSSSAGSSPMSPSVFNSDSKNSAKRSEPLDPRPHCYASPTKKFKMSQDEPDPVSLPRVLSNGIEKEIGTMTDPEKLGPCEPGTAVKLQGIVWQETDKGMLVLNVTWKGKTFMGTLLDCQRQAESHKWGPPRDAVSARGRTRRGGRNSRARTPPVKIPIKKGLGANKNSSAVNGSDPSSPSNKIYVGPLLREDEPGPIDRECDALMADGSQSPDSKLVRCPRSPCLKRFRDLEALKYHLSFAHDDLKKLEENESRLAKESSTPAKGEPIKKEMKPELKAEVKAEPFSLVVKKESEPETKKDLPAPVLNGRESQKVSVGFNHGIVQMLGPRLPPPKQPLGYGTVNGTSNYAAKLPGVQPKQDSSNNNQRTVSPAYSDISDEEPETPAPIGLTTKPLDPKQSLLAVRRDNPEPSRGPLDLTQPNLDSFPGVRPTVTSSQFSGIPPHLLQAAARFPPAGLSSSTPSLNMLHSIMNSAKLQEIQQAMNAGSPLPAHRSPVTTSSPSLQKGSPFTKSPLSVMQPLRQELSHLPGFQGQPPLTSKLTAEATKRLPPVVSSPSMPQLPAHLSPFSIGPFGLGSTRMASPYPPKH